MQENNLISDDLLSPPTIVAEANQETLLSVIEPFLDLDIAKLRLQLIDQTIVTQQKLLIKEKLGSITDTGFYDRLVTTLAEIKAEMYYLKTAYIETTRYSEPKFELTLPKLPDKVPIDILEIDMRSDITGSNWWFAEKTGRWAGPENTSTLFIPALGAGNYQIEINISMEIIPGIIDTITILFNRNPVNIKRLEAKLPTKLLIEVQVKETYRLPFWSLKFYFQKLASPKQFGATDARMLAIYVNSVRIIRVSV